MSASPHAFVFGTSYINVSSNFRIIPPITSWFASKGTWEEITEEVVDTVKRTIPILLNNSAS